MLNRLDAELQAVIKPSRQPLAISMGTSVYLLGHADHELVVGN